MPHIIYAWQEIKGWASIGLVFAWCTLVGGLVLLLACYYIAKLWITQKTGQEEMTC